MRQLRDAPLHQFAHREPHRRLRPLTTKEFYAWTCHTTRIDGSLPPSPPRSDSSLLPEFYTRTLSSNPGLHKICNNWREGSRSRSSKQNGVSAGIRLQIWPRYRRNFWKSRSVARMHSTPIDLTNPPCLWSESMDSHEIYNKSMLRITESDTNRNKPLAAADCRWHEPENSKYADG
jgi:hypothetical protein